MNILSEEKIFSQEELQEQKISSVSMGMLRAFDVLLKFFRKGSQENFRSYKVTIPVTGYLDVEVGANTMQIVVANTTTGYLDSTKIRLGELMFTYPIEKTQFDNFLLPKIGMGFRLYGTSGDDYLITETIHTELCFRSNPITKNTTHGEILLIGPNANISLAAGATYNSPTVNLLGSRSLVGFQDISNLGVNEMQSWIYMKTSTLNAIQYYTYASSGGYQGYDPVLSNSGAGNSGIYTDQTYYSVQANPANTQAIIINGLALGVS